MKRLVVFLNLSILFIASCASHKMSTSNDDVYANPKQDRIEEARIVAEKKLVREAANRKYNDSIAAVNKVQKEKDDANPYYKDREFKYDDYYDYEYATRVKRFDNNINGLSYYDNYYTNSYWYNQNPYNYGVSVYNGYSWWGQSYNNYSYNPSVGFYSGNGWGNNYGYSGFNGYNPYDPFASAYWQGFNNGYNQGYNNGWAGYPYNGYGNYGFNSFGFNPYGYGGGGYGYNNYNNGWGYYNILDHNSSYSYGPRASHTGGNSQRTSNPGVNSSGDSYSEKYINSVNQQQAAQQRFNAVQPLRTGTPSYNNNNVPSANTGNQPVIDNNTNPSRNTGNGRFTKNPTRNYGNEEVIPVKQQPINNGDIKPVRQYENQPLKQPKQQPVRQYDNQPLKQNDNQPTKQQYEAPVRQNTPMQIPSKNDGGGRSAPSNNGSGGRPR